MPKQPSRSARWATAVAEAKDQFQAVQDAASGLGDAMQAIHDVQQEYQDWLDNLPENLENSALGEKLTAVCDIDIESLTDDPLSDWPQLESTLEEAEGADLPMGFGRD
jgi:hypothetical protein